MSFDDLMTDTIKILRKDGQIFEGVKASVQKGKIFINRSDVLIERGDLIQRSMSNGAEATYEVGDPGFHEEFHGIPAGYQMEVKELGAPEAKEAVQHITYNLSGSNHRINTNSTDNSINVVHISDDMQAHIDALRKEIQNSDIPKTDAEASYEVIDAVEQQLDSDNPSKAVIQTLLKGLPHVGSVASIIGLIISAF